MLSKLLKSNLFIIHSILIVFLLFFTDTALAKKDCATKSFSINLGFLSSGISSCEIVNQNYIKLYLAPEDNDVINPSPWYAFKKSPHKEKVYVEIFYEKFKHRYHPKISFDSENWRKLESKSFKQLDDGQRILLQFNPERKESIISAQEILSTEWYDRWIKRLSLNDHIMVNDLGKSFGKRPIKKISIIGDPNNPYIFILGRQHPPEVSGALALKGFIETIIAKNPLSKEFTNNFNIIVYPLLNPDGVDLGHWRHNLSSKDLNRDWGFFTQVETELVYADIQKILSENRRIIFLLDFHSTFENLFYIQDIEEEKDLEFNVSEWLKGLKDSLKNYNYSIRPVKSRNNGVAKNFFYQEFGISTITYEVGDETDRMAIASSSEIFSKAFMNLLLEKRVIYD